jgi:hypothetical protein
LAVLAVAVMAVFVLLQHHPQAVLIIQAVAVVVDLRQALCLMVKMELALMVAPAS